jgi:hypothetical protein
MFKRVNHAALGALFAAAAFATGASAQTLSPGQAQIDKLLLGIQLNDVSKPASTIQVTEYPGNVIHDVGAMAWPSSSGQKYFQIRYDNSTLTVGVSLCRENPAVTDCSDTAIVPLNAALQNQDLMQLWVKGNQEPVFGMSTIYLGGLGFYQNPPVAAVNANESRYWYINNQTQALAPNFNFTAYLDGAESSDPNGSQIRIDLAKKFNDLQGPVVTISQPANVLVNEYFRVTADLDDSGGNPISGAQYSIDGVWAPVAMKAVDADGFNTSHEVAQGEWTRDPQPGTHEACVKGWDSNLNEGRTCSTYTVSYRFDGFVAPIDSAPVLNQATAGQVVPVKWRLSDATGAAIADPASFRKINVSAPFTCDSSAMFDVIPAPRPALVSSTVPQLQSDGTWQLNWKTPSLPKGAASQCYQMTIDFNDLKTSPPIFFKIVK